MNRLSFLASALALLLAGPARGHDLWLVPASVEKAGDRATLRACSGMDFPVSVNAVAPDRLARAVVRAPSGVVRPLGEFRAEGETLLASVVAWEAGTQVAALETKPRVLALKAEEFNDYLLHDGLPDVHAWRKERGLLGKDAVERYSKFPKALYGVGVGGPSGKVSDPLGLPLEIVPLADPLALHEGDDLAVRVLFRGAPLANALLCRDVPGNGAEFAGTTRTDARGEAKVPLGPAGLFTIRLVHMTRPEAADFEWESFWASLTFEVAPKKGGA